MLAGVGWFAGVLGVTQAGLAAELPSPSVADIQEMAGIFDGMCLRAFPDEAAVAKHAAELDAKRMSRAQVKSYLHDDPGYGWYVTTSVATYAITVEQPPYRACGVRRMTPAGFSTVRPYLEAIRNYAASNGLPAPVNSGEQKMKTPGGADISVYAQSITVPGAPKPASTFLLLLTNYHGRFAGDLAADVGTGGVGVEIRFVHEYMPPD